MGKGTIGEIYISQKLEEQPLIAFLREIMCEIILSVRLHPGLCVFQQKQNTAVALNTVKLQCSTQPLCEITAWDVCELSSVAVGLCAG